MYRRKGKKKEATEQSRFSPFFLRVCVFDILLCYAYAAPIRGHGDVSISRCPSSVLFDQFIRNPSRALARTRIITKAGNGVGRGRGRLEVNRSTS